MCRATIRELTQYVSGLETARQLLDFIEVYSKPRKRDITNFHEGRRIERRHDALQKQREIQEGKKDYRILCNVLIA